MSTDEYESDIQPQADAPVVQPLDQRAIYAAVRQELSSYSRADLKTIMEPRFIFRDSDPEFRARITLRQRVAEDILDGQA